jgi:hypothetical protein
MILSQDCIKILREPNKKGRDRVPFKQINSEVL